MKCASLFVSVTHQIHTGYGEGALSCGINSWQQTFGSGSLDRYPVVPTSTALPREQRGWCGADTGNVLGLDVPSMETPGLAATEGDGVIVLIPSQRSEGPSVFGGSMLLRHSSCQAGQEQQLGEPH